MPSIRTLLPPGGFSNLVGHHVAALDHGSRLLAEAARALGAKAFRAGPSEGRPGPGDVLLAVGRREAAWIHEAVGGVPTPEAPEDLQDPEALLAWLEAVRTVSLMVLRPLQDRDLERLVTVPGVEGLTSLRRLLADLLEHQGYDRGRLAALGTSTGA